MTALEKTLRAEEIEWRKKHLFLQHLCLTSLGTEDPSMQGGLKKLLLGSEEGFQQ